MFDTCKKPDHPFHVVILKEPEDDTIAQELEASKKPPGKPWPRHHDGRMFIGSGEDAHLFI